MKKSDLKLLAEAARWVRGLDFDKMVLFWKKKAQPKDHIFLRKQLQYLIDTAKSERRATLRILDHAKES